LPRSDQRLRLSAQRRVGPEQVAQIDLRHSVDQTNVAYFSVKPFAILRLILARGSVSQS
jgi:hypothetical protein